MKVKKITKPELEGDTYLIGQAVNHNAEVLEKVLNRVEKLEEWVSEEKPLEIEEFVKSKDMTREEAISIMKNVIYMLDPQYYTDITEGAVTMAIKALEQEPIKANYTRQVVKERDVAIGQLNELGYSLGEKIRACEKEAILDKIRAEIEVQEKWLAEAGYNAYNVGIAFESIKRALGK